MTLSQFLFIAGILLLPLRLISQDTTFVQENPPEYDSLKLLYPFLNLQKNLTEMEEQIAAARRAYNAAVTDFNNSCEMFPTNIFASLFKFEKKNLFQVSDNEKQPVKAVP